MPKGRFGEIFTFEPEQEPAYPASQGRYGPIVTFQEEATQSPQATSVLSSFKEEFTSPELSPFEEGIGQTIRGLASGAGSLGDLFSLAAAPGKYGANFLSSLLGLPDIPQASQILPTSSQTESGFDYLTEDKFQPQSRGEEIMQEIPKRGIRAALTAPLGIPALLSALSGEGTGLATKEAVRSLGGGETAQTIGDIIGGVAGGGLASAVQKRSGVAPKGLEAVEEFGKKKGFTEKELTPLLQSESKGKYFSKLARKSPKDKEMFEKIENKFGNVFSEISEQASKLPRLNEAQESKLASSLEDITSNLRKTIQPSKDKEDVINFIEKSLSSVYEKGVQPEELINYYRDINQTVNWNAMSGGKKKLDAVKTVIKDTLREVDPNLAQEFDLSNKLYAQFKKTEKLLKPNTYDKFLEMQKVIGFPLGIAQYVFSGNPTGILGEIGIVGAREGARQAIMNPSFQNLTQNFIKAINANSPKVAKHFSDKMEKEISKEKRKS